MSVDARKTAGDLGWFVRDRFGMFIHWGPYAALGRGVTSLFREHLDQREYAENACRWNPRSFEAASWAAVAKRTGMRYAVFTTRHCDGYCMWDSQFTDYSSGSQAPRRDFVREYVEAFRAVGLRVGFYYSLADWRIPAYWEGPAHDPEGWEIFRTYVHNQVKELLTHYGPVDVMWFDGAWPHNQEAWKSAELMKMIRSLQPHILINNRLGAESPDAQPSESLPQYDEQGHLILGAEPLDDPNPGGWSLRLGDFGTPEHHTTPDSSRPWESCQVSTWRLWGYAIGERWRPADLLLDILVDAVSKGGNLLLNVGPDPDGQLPPEFIERAEAIGQWMDVHGEAIYGSEVGEVCDFTTYGRQTHKGNNLYLIIRFWDGRDVLTLAGLETRVRRAVLLTTGRELTFSQTADFLTMRGLPHEPPTDLFPVIKLECDGPPRPREWAANRMCHGDPRRMTGWAAARGVSVFADGKPRQV